jgi:hypothetical protein
MYDYSCKGILKISATLSNRLTAIEWVSEKREMETKIRNSEGKYNFMCMFACLDFSRNWIR